MEASAACPSSGARCGALPVEVGLPGERSGRSASPPAPSMRADLRRRRNCMPIRYIPRAPRRRRHRGARAPYDPAPARRARSSRGGIPSPRQWSVSRRFPRSMRQGRRRVDLGGLEALWWRHRRRRGRSRAAHSSMVLSRRFIFRSDSAHWFLSDPENCALPSLMPARRPTSFTPTA